MVFLSIIQYRNQLLSCYRNQRLHRRHSPRRLRSEQYTHTNRTMCERTQTPYSGPSRVHPNKIRYSLQMLNVAQ